MILEWVVDSTEVKRLFRVGSWIVFVRAAEATNQTTLKWLCQCFDVAKMFRLFPSIIPANIYGNGHQDRMDQWSPACLVPWSHDRALIRPEGVEEDLSRNMTDTQLDEKRSPPAVFRSFSTR